MRKFMRRPAIVLALIFVVIFVMLIIDSYINLVEDLSEANAIRAKVSDEKFSEYEQELKSLVLTDELKLLVEPTLRAEITLG